MGSTAGVCRDMGPQSGPGAWLRLARLAATYLLILTFVAPPLITGPGGPAAQRNQKSGRRHRNHRPSAASKVLISRAADQFRSPERSTAIADDSHRTLLSTPELTPALAPNSSALSRVFRPLRC